MSSSADMPVEYRLTDASPSDRGWLDGLRRRAYADLFVSTWGAWDEARHARQFSESWERGNISLIEVDGERVGMIQLMQEGDGVEVREIQIDPRHQGRGIGTRVLLDVISEARSGARDVHLSVGLKNEKAIRLYERLGFVSVGRSETHRHMRCPATAAKSSVEETENEAAEAKSPDRESSTA